MHVTKDFKYYHNLDRVITNALLCSVAMTPRYVPVAKRNEILVKFLKPMLNDKSLANIRKDLKLMIITTRHKGSNLEMKLYELHEKANHVVINGAERLYSLLTYLYDEKGIESKLFDENDEAQPEVLYMLADHIEHCFNANQQQVAPLSMLIQSQQAQELIDVINQHGWFHADMKEWEPEKGQAHIQLHTLREQNAPM